MLKIQHFTVEHRIEPLGLDEERPAFSYRLESDRRNKLVRLTPAGDDLAGSLIPELSRLERFVMEKMGEEGRRGLIEGMALFVKYFREGSPEL